ncbi:MAG: hypothetical protein KF819_11465 [Labilithrix sp.]|nr:hypothetical protein [Labilithrix sp.]
MSGLDVMHARVSFRDRAFIDVLDLALRFMAEHARLYAKIAAVVLVPSFGVALAAASAWGWIAGWIFAVVLAFFAQVPFTILASRLVFQETLGARDVLRLAARELPRIFVMRLLSTGLLAGATAIFIVPVFWVGSTFVYLNEVMVLERAAVGHAFGRARRVVSSSFLDAFGSFVVAILLPLIAVLLAEVGGRGLLSELFQFRPPASAVQQGGGSALCLVGWFAVVPYLATARFFAFLNVRTRVEGWDIQTKFAALAQRGEAHDARASVEP